MSPLKTIAALVLPLAIGFSPNLLGSDLRSTCTPTQLRQISEIAADHPVLDIIAQNDLSIACRTSLLDHLANILIAKETLGLCPDSWCPSMMEGVRLIEEALLEISKPSPDQKSADFITPWTRQNFEEADALIGEAILAQIETIESKISRGLIPNCLLASDCLKPGFPCRQKLTRQWWQETIQLTPTEEFWIAPASFDHLLLADAFTCNAGQQIGPSCALYSAVNLMNHYCQTPIRQSQNRQNGGPSTCPDVTDVLQTAYDQDIWGLDQCQNGDCRPIFDNPRENNGDLTSMENHLILSYNQEMEKKYCGNDALYRQNKTKCDQYRLSIEQLIPIQQELQQRDEALESQGYPNPGTRNSIKTVAQLTPIYKHYGFFPVTFIPYESGWNAALLFLESGRPVQLGLFPQDWYDSSEGPDQHAIVLVGHWRDEAGLDRVMILDSMNPEAIKVFSAHKTKQEFFQSTGGLGLCTIHDPSPLCN